MENTAKPMGLIVGGSKGMGLATAKRLLERGIHTVIIGNSTAKLESAKRDLSRIGSVETLQANLYEANEVQRVINLVTNEKQHIKYLVNAVGGVL